MEEHRLQDSLGVAPAAAETESTFLHSVTAQTPWWIVSVLMHSLIIALAGLLSMAITLPDEPPIVITSTEWNKPRAAIEMPELTKVKGTPNALVDDTYSGKKTDDAQSDIFVTPEIAQLGVEALDFETIDQGVFEKVGAHGEPDSKIFYRISGETGALGGGGRPDAFALADDLLGVEGLGSKGKGGNGMGGGFGDGIGAANGNGRAPFGSRNAGGKRLAFRKFFPTVRGTPPSEDAVRRALQWLAYHQEADGRWDAAKYGAAQKTDTAVTAFALLAFLGYGHTEKIGEHKLVIQRAVNWLRSKQDEKGMVWDKTDAGGHRGGGYPVSIATMALAEAAGMANVPETREAAQRAIRYCTEHHQYGDGSDKGGWRYAEKSEGDLSVTGWFVMALKSAKIAGLKVDPNAFDGAMRFIDKCEIREGGDTSGYGAAMRFKYMANNEHAQTAHRLTAIGTLARQFLGWKPDEVRGGVEWFINKGGLPSYGANGENVDLYYWYYASMSVFQCDVKMFNTWSDAMLKAMLPHQCAGGDNDGSWNPTGAYSDEWGRVGQTALSALCLEVYYRKERLEEHR